MGRGVGLTPVPAGGLLTFLPCGRPFHALSCGLLNAFVCICPSSEALTENRSQLRAAKGAGTVHEKGKQNHMKTMLQNRNSDKKKKKKKRRRWGGREIAPEGQMARLPSSLARKPTSPGGALPWEGGRGGRPHCRAAGRQQQRELGCECSPQVHLRFKGDSDSSGVLCFGPGRRKRWGEGTR